MTVSEEQWAAAAADLKMTVEGLREQVAAIDSRDVSNFPPPAYDRDGDALTLGEWSVLYESPSYKFIAETTLPNGRWVATIWHGINEDGDYPPIVLRSGVFAAPPEPGQRLGGPIVERKHQNVEDALKGHRVLIEEWSG